MTREKVELIIEEIKKQIIQLNIMENFTLFKADEFVFKITVGVVPQSATMYNITYTIDITHPLSGYHIVVNITVEDIVDVAKAIVMILKNAFVQHYMKDPLVKNKMIWMDDDN